MSACVNDLAFIIMANTPLAASLLSSMRLFPAILQSLLMPSRPLSLLLFALTALAGCSAPPPPAVAPKAVLVQQAVSASSGGEGNYVGEIRARYESDLAFRVGGKILARQVEVGSLVQAGQTLARLDPTDLKLAAQAAQAQVAAAQSEWVTAKAERERYADLLGKKFVSQAAFDSKENALKTAAAKLDQVKAQAEVSTNQSGYGNLVSDRAGVVTAILAEAGQVVGAGQTVMRVARTEEKEVLVAIPENRVQTLRQSPPLQVSFWALPGVTVTGSLRELSPAADPATRTYAARIRLPQAPEALALGMSARVTVAGLDAGTAAQVAVPMTAVVDQGQGPAVWVVLDNKVQKKPVQVGRFEDQLAWVSGVQAGEWVVVAGTNKLAPDMAVTPRPAPTPNQQK